MTPADARDALASFVREHAKDPQLVDDVRYRGRSRARRNRKNRAR